MKVKKLIKHLKDNTNIIFYKDNAEKPFAQCDSIFLLRNYPLDYESYILLNYKIKNFIPCQFPKTDKGYLKIMVEDDNE